MESTLIDQGLNLMLYGMGTVFVFLTLLVFATTLMSKIVGKLSPDETADDRPASRDTATSINTQPSPQLVKAIEKAIQAHRANNKNK